ncbi:hypothetical protein WN55_03986 [Dufourea novaeangliae]|uniref:Uncharacterized protein n=1 Tax=Dufourea novaeangliae TaxID=178035 RepID=A0A154PMC9_DUFNO|nr:hypothetical protein WN55_03986 [Dufourea novaeangliae]
MPLFAIEDADARIPARSRYVPTTKYSGVARLPQPSRSRELNDVESIPPAASGNQGGIHRRETEYARDRERKGVPSIACKRAA